jgi:hypothetical protein
MKIFVILRPDHVLHPPYGWIDRLQETFERQDKIKDKKQIIDLILDLYKNLWSQWKTYSQVDGTDDPISIKLYSQCPCCDGISPPSSSKKKYCQFYWDLVSSLLTGACRLRQHKNNDGKMIPEMISFQDLLPCFPSIQENDKITITTNDFWDSFFQSPSVCSWNSTPQDLPSTISDEKDWLSIMRLGRMVAWSYEYLLDSSFTTMDTMEIQLLVEVEEKEDENPNPKRMYTHNTHIQTKQNRMKPRITTPNLYTSKYTIHLYDVEWLVIKWIKGLGSYDDDISTVIPSYPCDELNRPLPPWLIRSLFHRYKSLNENGNGKRVLLKPLALLVDTETGYSLLETVFELDGMIKKAKKIGSDGLIVNKTVLSFFWEKRVQALQERKEDLAYFLWESNYCVQLFYERGPPPKICPTVLFTHYLGQSMMWIGEPFVSLIRCGVDTTKQRKGLEMMWEGFWTRSIFWNSTSGTDKNTTMFLGEFVLTEDERSRVFARVLSLLNHQASKTTKTPNWASIKTASKSLSSNKKHLKEKVMERWIEVFQHLLRYPDTIPTTTTTTTPMTSSVEYFENFGWIDEEHIREHGQQDRYPEYVRTACLRLADVFRDMLKRNLFLLISSNLAYEDNQSRCLDHLSFLDHDKSYPDLYAFR